MPHRRRRKRKSKFVTKRGLPFQLMKYAESKFLTFSLADFLLTSPATSGLNLRSLVNIREGPGINERIGRQIQLTGIYVKIIYNAVNDNNTRWMRVTLSQPRLPDVIEQPTVGMVDSPSFNETIMWFDKTVLCPTIGAATPGGVMVLKKKFKPYIKVRYENNLGADIFQSQLFLTLLPKDTLSVIVSMEAKVYFKDL